MTGYTLIESRPRVLPLTSAEATALSELGRSLAAGGRPGGLGASPLGEQTVIDCRLHPRGYLVTVRNCIGAIGLDGIALQIQPKIPRDHFVYLMQLAHRMPRTEATRALSVESATLWSLLVSWFLSATEDLIVRQLARGYCEVSGQLPFIRGRMDVPRSAVLWKARGIPESVCTYEEFEINTPLNRVIRHAAAVVAGSPLLERDMRRRAVAVLDHMDGVGPMLASDLATAEVDRNTSYYSDALPLAVDVLDSMGRFPGLGDNSAWTYLIRTPELVQDAIRRLLVDRLDVPLRPKRQGGSLRLQPSTATVNPDLVFPSAAAIGDVKYKLEPRSRDVGIDGWRRSDLYEVVSFAAAYRVSKTIVIGFCRARTTQPLPLQVGDVGVAYTSWPVDRQSDPESSAASVVESVRMFLSS